MTKEKNAGRAIGALLLIALAALAVKRVAAEPSSEPAIWTQYDMLVDLHQLPKRYSCDALWYRFHDVLWSIGAREIKEILPYQCGSAAGELALSPRVHLRFSLPSVVRSDQAVLRVASTTIRLEPGEPRSLDASDCALLSQMKDTLFAALPVRVVSSSLECTATNHSQFSVSVQALTPQREMGQLNPQPG
jgi:hypothetical protein